MASLEEDLGSELVRTMGDFKAGKRRDWLRRTILKVRCRIIHLIDENRVKQSHVENVSKMFSATKERHHNLHRIVHRGLGAGLINKDEYDLALKILGSSEARFNQQPLAEKVAIETLASLVLIETGGRKHA